MSAAGSDTRLRVALLTREFPPHVYGGAGVHVEYLARELRRRVALTVHAWDAGDVPAAPWDALRDGALGALSAGLAMADTVVADVVHSHTWYTQLGGHLAALEGDIPHVTTVHSLEPLRPWKAEQLGGGYAVSSWAERTALEGAAAIVAVSDGSRADILDCYPRLDPARVVTITNGIDADEYRPDAGTDVLERLGVDPARPSVVFVGRITRQKGVTHLLRAARDLDPDAQLVLCAGAPDTPEILAEVQAGVDALRARRDGVVWVREMLPKADVIQLLSHAAVFACPSVYEPLGIVNLEAMACEAAVVATATGGIVEVVADGDTGLLVPLDPAPGSIEPADPAAFARAFAERVNALLADPGRARAMGEAGRRRAIERFDWAAIADRTVALYRDLTR